MRLYFDVCCLNRPFDDQSQPRIHLEAEAIIMIFREIEAGIHEWVGSEVLMLEINRTPDSKKRRNMLSLLSNAGIYANLEKTAIERAKILESLGFASFDALHLACAEQAQTDIFFTTDDRFLKKAKEYFRKLKVDVCNPLKWMEE
jgi:predicted nucleic acid-binding protein